MLLVCLIHFPEKCMSQLLMTQNLSAQARLRLTGLHGSKAAGTVPRLRQLLGILSSSVRSKVPCPVKLKGGTAAVHRAARF